MSIPSCPSEFSNWRDEQAAWRKTCVLFDQSHHMVDLYIEGPGRDEAAVRTSRSTASTNFPVNRAKQFVPCSYSGHVIGDGILFHLEKNKLVFVGRAPSANWIQFHAETGKYQRQDQQGRPLARQSEGQGRQPHLVSLPDPGPERLEGHREAERRAGAGDQVLPHGHDQDRGPQDVRALRHGMAGAPGLEIWGPYKEREEDPRDDHRGRRRVRPAPGRLARLRDEHARVGLDSVAAAGRLHGRAHEEVPQVAAGQ